MQQIWALKVEWDVTLARRYGEMENIHARHRDVEGHPHTKEGDTSCGPKMLLAEIKQSYSPLRGRIKPRSTVTRCFSCVRTRPRFETPLMAPLPKQRVKCLVRSQ